MKNQIIPKNEIQEKYLVFNEKNKEYVKIRKNSYILKKDAVSIKELWTTYTGQITYVIEFVDGTSDWIVGKVRKVITESWLEKRI
jgi:hypothetical protein